MKDILPTPQQLIEHLDIYVHGQNAAKRALSKAIYFHYLNLVLSSRSPHRMPKEHTIIVGPTGCGKTLLVKTLGEYLGVPVFFCNAASLTAEGYVGESVGDMLARMQHFCDNNRFKMERAILFLDEIDKLSSKEGGVGGGDVGGGMVQDELLAVLDGNRLTRGKKQGAPPEFDLDTGKILIIAAGAFSGIQNIVDRRTAGSARIGFGRAETCDHDSAGDDNPPAVESPDIIEYGFIPEFIARFPNLVRLAPLTEEDFQKILLSPNQSPIPHQKLCFKLHGLDLEFTNDAISELARRAASSPNGGRGLRQQVLSVLGVVDWQLDALWEKGVNRIVIDADTVRGQSQPKYVQGGQRSDSSALELRRLVFKEDTVAKSVWDGQPKSSCVKDPVQTNDLEEREKKIRFKEASESAKKWWRAFENENGSRTALVNKLVNELIQRNASLQDFFLAYVYSETDNIQANLYYLDFLKEKRKEVDRRVAVSAPLSDGPHAAGCEEARQRISFEASSPRGRLMWECTEKYFDFNGPKLLLHCDELAKRNISSADIYFESGALAFSSQPIAVLNYLDFYHIKFEQEMRGQNRLEPKALAIFELSRLEGSPTADASPLVLCFAQTRSLARQIFLRRIAGAHRELSNKYSKEWGFPVEEALIIWRPGLGKAGILKVVDGPWHGGSVDKGFEIWSQALRLYPGEIDGMSFAELALSQLAGPLLEKVLSGLEVDLSNYTKVIGKSLKWLVHQQDLGAMLLSFMASTDRARESKELLQIVQKAESNIKGITKLWQDLIEP